LRAGAWRKRHAVWLFLVLVLLGLVALLITNDVSTALTQDDAVYAERILSETGHGDIVSQAPPASFDDQVRTILAVQDAVLSMAPKNKGLPLGKPRELRELYEAKHGLCYDRSRAIEKILSSLGFEVRHAAVYSTKDGSALTALVTPRTPSHAVTEVKTDRGWVVVDSNRHWIGLTSDGKAVDLATLKTEGAGQRWDARLKEDMSLILAHPFTYLFGLYSRHGRFYPPYTPVPDVDWGQVPYNVTD
jgi:Transglutaminase-like superfamily